MDLSWIVTELTNLWAHGLSGHVAEAVTQKTAEKGVLGVIEYSASAAKSGWLAFERVLRGSSTHRQFEKKWAHARNPGEREAAVLELLQKDPRLAEKVSQMLVQRNYLIGIAAYCQALPFLDLLFPNALIDDVFVDLPVSVSRYSRAEAAQPRMINATELIADVIHELSSADINNYAIFGGPGAGKTTFGRLLTTKYCLQILTDPATVADTNVLLPVYVAATALMANRQDLRTALLSAVQHDTGLCLDSPISAEFFARQLQGNTRQWLIVIDAIDEIVNNQSRRDLMHAIRRVHLEYGRTFRFVISCRDSALAQEILGSDFRIVHLDDPPPERAQVLFKKYSQLLGKPVTDAALAHFPFRTFTPLLNSPLLIAIAAHGLSDIAPEKLTIRQLFDDFVKYLLRKRNFSLSEARALNQLLGEIAELGDRAPVDARLTRRAEELEVIQPGLPTAMARRALLERLIASGLLIARGGEIRFAHTSLRLFFRAAHFAERHAPTKSVWELLDPHLNGWDFAQFVLESWHARGLDLTPVSESLLSYGIEGLRLLSRIAAQYSRFPNSMVSAAARKWLARLADEPFDPIDGAIRNLSLISEHYPSTLHILELIALDAETYFDTSIDAARELAKKGRITVARDALLRVIDLEHPPSQALAAGCLCEIGFPADGRLLLNTFIADWRGKDSDHLLGSVFAIEALHATDGSAHARTQLDELANNINGSLYDAQLIAETYEKIAGKRQAVEFLTEWRDRHPQSASVLQALPSPSQPLQHWSSQVIEDASSQHRDESESSHSVLLARLADIPELAGKLIEMSRNSFLPTPRRFHAIQQLLSLDAAAYLDAALYVIGDFNSQWFEREKLVTQLRSRGHRTAVINALSQPRLRENSSPLCEAELLLSAGDRPRSMELLEIAANDSSSKQDDAAAAVGLLADIGAGARALDHFRRLVATRKCSAQPFAKMCKTLLVTEYSTEVRATVWNVMRNRAQPIDVRLSAAELLYSPDLPKDELGSISRFVQRVAHNNGASLESRMAAIDLWHEFDLESAWEYCLWLTENPKTPFDLGMQAAERVAEWSEAMFSINAYHDVVWDKKISRNEHIKGLLHIREHFKIESGFSDEPVVPDFIGFAEQELARAAADPELDPQLRLNALGIADQPWARLSTPTEEDIRWPPEPAVRAFLDDSQISPYLKQTCVLLLCAHKPRLAARWLSHLDTDRRNVPALLRAMSHLHENHAHDILDCVTALARDPRIATGNRLEAIRLLCRAGQSTLSQQLLRELTRDASFLPQTPPQNVIDVVRLLLQIGKDAAALSFCLEFCSAPATPVETVVEVAQYLASEGFSMQAKQILRALLRASFSGQRDLDWGAYSTAMTLLNLGETAEAQDAFIRLAQAQKVPVTLRIQCCRIVLQLGNVAIARDIVRRISLRGASRHDRSRIAQCRIELNLPVDAETRKMANMADEATESADASIDTFKRLIEAKSWRKIESAIAASRAEPDAEIFNLV